MNSAGFIIYLLHVVVASHFQLISMILLDCCVGFKIDLVLYLNHFICGAKSWSPLDILKWKRLVVDVLVI